MSLGDVLIGIGVGILDGVLFGILAVLLALGAGVRPHLGFTEAAAAPRLAGTLFLALGVVWLPVSAYSYHRFRADQEYFPVLRTTYGAYRRLRGAA